MATTVDSKASQIHHHLKKTDGKVTFRCLNISIEPNLSIELVRNKPKLGESLSLAQTLCHVSHKRQCLSMEAGAHRWTTSLDDASWKKQEAQWWWQQESDARKIRVHVDCWEQKRKELKKCRIQFSFPFCLCISVLYDVALQTELCLFLFCCSRFVVSWNRVSFSSFYIQSKPSLGSHKQEPKGFVLFHIGLNIWFLTREVCVALCLNTNLKCQFGRF